MCSIQSLHMNLNLPHVRVMQHLANCVFYSKNKSLAQCYVTKKWRKQKKNKYENWKKKQPKNGDKTNAAKRKRKSKKKRLLNFVFFVLFVSHLEERQQQSLQSVHPQAAPGSSGGCHNTLTLVCPANRGNSSIASQRSASPHRISQKAFKKALQKRPDKSLSRIKHPNSWVKLPHRKAALYIFIFFFHGLFFFVFVFPMPNAFGFWFVWLNKIPRSRRRHLGPIGKQWNLPARCQWFYPKKQCVCVYWCECVRELWWFMCLDFGQFSFLVQRAAVK